MSKLYGNRKRAKAASALQDVLSNVIHPKAGGIDMGSTEMVAGIPIGLSDGAHIRTFNTFTRGIIALRDWLLSCGITTVAIESTGNYWVTTYDILTEAGIDVWLVNARSVNGAPGRKTDVCDAQWLQQLHAAGLLKRSHRPEKEIIPLRYLMRHRADLVAQCAQQLQLMQKVMTEMNLHIHHVFSDIDGMSAQAIITAILAGERDPLKLAALRDKRCRSKLSDIVDALNGNYREEYLFVLKQLQQSCQQKQAMLVEVDAELAKIIARIEEKVEGPLLPATPKQKVKNKNEPANMIMSQEAWRFFGVDLSTVPGIGSGFLGVLMSEIGTREHFLNAFKSADAFTSWLGLCPENCISGGRTLKSKTRKVIHRLADAFRLSANAVTRSNDAMGQFCRRMKGRLGKAEGIVAVAHKIARIVYAMISSGKPYDEKVAFQVTTRTLTKRMKNLQKQAAALGMQLIPA